MRFRNIEPAVYNEQRLNEQPIPELIAEHGSNTPEDDMIDADDQMIEPTIDHIEENNTSELNKLVQSINGMTCVVLAIVKKRHIRLVRLKRMI